MNFNPQTQACESDIYWSSQFSPNQGFNISFSPRPSYQDGHDILRQFFTTSPGRGLSPPTSTGVSNGLLYQSFVPFSPYQTTDTVNLPSGQFRSSFPSPLPPLFPTVDEFDLQIPPQDFHDGEFQRIETLAGQHSSQEVNPKRPRKNISQWDKYKDQIKKFYLDEGKSVEETRDCMREQYGFDASAGAYKTKFTQWGFVKNLSKDRANWMLVKASRRKEQENKDTVFEIGDRTFTVDRVQQSLKRTRGGQNSVAVEKTMSSPEDIRCITPSVPVSSSRRTFSPAAQPPWIGGLASMPPPQLPPLRNLRLTWDVHSEVDIDARRRRARELDQQGKPDSAEQEYREVLNSLRQLHFPTHNETSIAAYDLADFYARHRRMDEADNILDQIGKEHHNAFGEAHPKTVEHGLRVAKLFDNWSRKEDASAQFFRVLECVTRLLPNNIESLDSDEEVIGLQDEAMENDVTSSDRSDRAGKRLGMGDEEVQQLLPQIIEECEKQSSQLSVQLIKTRCLQLDLCRLLKDEGNLTLSLEQAQDAVMKVLCSEKPVSLSLLLPSFGLIGRFVQNDRLPAADKMFREMERLLTQWEDGADDDTICFIVGVGKVFESQSWNLARRRFERALAATMSGHAQNCEGAKRLEVALSEKRLAPSLGSDHQWPCRIGQRCSLGRRLLRLSQLGTLSALAKEIFL